MKRALILYCLALAAANVAGAETPAPEEKAKNPDCPFLQLSGVAMLDDRTFILDMSTRVKAAPQNRRWFKVTFVSNCRRLGTSHFFALESAGCPRHGDLVVFSRRPNPSEEDVDRCTIDQSEEIPVQATPAKP